MPGQTGHRGQAARVPRECQCPGGKIRFDAALLNRGMRLQSLLVEEKALKTLKGSPIKRSKLGVGKDIGGEIYLHRQYESEVLNQAALGKAKAALAENYPAFKYRALKFDKAGRFTFFEAPDFDTADEPTPGNYITVTPDGKAKPGSTKSIWHHKWLWVKDGYKGFDVSTSFERSKKWLALPDIDFSRIGSKEVWERDVVPLIK